MTPRALAVASYTALIGPAPASSSTAESAYAQPATCRSGCKLWAARRCGPAGVSDAVGPAARALSEAEGGRGSGADRPCGVPASTVRDAKGGDAQSPPPCAACNRVRHAAHGSPQGAAAHGRDACEPSQPASACDADGKTGCPFPRCQVDGRHGLDSARDSVRGAALARRRAAGPSVGRRRAAPGRRTRAASAASPCVAVAAGNLAAVIVALYASESTKRSLGATPPSLDDGSRGDVECRLWGGGAARGTTKPCSACGCGKLRSTGDGRPSAGTRAMRGKACKRGARRRVPPCARGSRGRRNDRATPPLLRREPSSAAKGPAARAGRRDLVRLPGSRMRKADYRTHALACGPGLCEKAGD